MPDRLVFVSVTPSPYQRDVFETMARRGRVGISVYYQERTPPDSPWPEKPLATWERVLPGFTMSWRGGRSHCNRGLPKARDGEYWVVNGSMSDVTTQLLMRRLGRRVPWAFWGELPSSPSKPWRRRLQSWQYGPLRRARHIAAIGRKAAAAYERLAPGVEVSNRPYACDLSAFMAAARERTAAAGVTFLFCGQMIPRKGIDLLLQAFAQTLSVNPTSRLLLVGREAGLEELLSGLPSSVRDRVEYAGFQPPEALPRWFARADVFVLPSRHDGWGVVVNQAIGAGLPCIVSDAVGAGELLTDGVHGRVVGAGDSKTLAEAMIRLATDPAMREDMASAVRLLADDLTPGKAAEFWETLALHTP